MKCLFSTIFGTKTGVGPKLLRDDSIIPHINQRETGTNNTQAIYIGRQEIPDLTLNKLNKPTSIIVKVGNGGHMEGNDRVREFTWNFKTPWRVLPPIIRSFARSRSSASL